MSVLRFNDGMTINTGGEYRVIEKADDLYVIGHGFCILVVDRAAGDRTVADMQARQGAR
jgi:K+/H+ antiporter YhaU regulatory subunit KhtT